MSSPRPRLFLVDTFGLIFRAYYGRARSSAPTMRTSAGLPTEAVYIFHNIIRKLIADYKPEYLAAVWEGEGPTFRDELFPAYKATRTETPAELIQQIPYIDRLLKASRIPILAENGYEADDVIGTIARKAAAEGVQVFIVSSDKDLMQLVDDGICVLNPMKDDLLCDAAKVKEIFGVEPKQIIDLLALKGDSVDNIPGAPGIGDKGARDLIEQYGSVEAAMEHAEEVTRKAYRESLQNHRDQILLSKRLATIALDAPLRYELEKLRANEPDIEELRKFYHEMEFRTFLLNLDIPQEEAKTDYREFESAEEFSEWIAGEGKPQDKSGPVSIAVGLSEGGEIASSGIAFARKPGQARLLPQRWLDAAKAFLEDGGQGKRVHDSKAAYRALDEAGIVLDGVSDDTMLGAFLDDSSRNDYTLPKVAAMYLGSKLDSDLAQAADFTQRIGPILAKKLDEQELRELYETMELPLAPVLARVEQAGVLLDSEMLAKLSADLEKRLERLTSEIHALGGSAFNINSPKQLSKVLFEDLGLPTPGRRGKTKTPSTAVDVLESLASEHEIAAKILEHRQLSKLKGTYIDALPALVSPRTGRLHTTFNQIGAATGRLSSLNPNLQNIPVRTELGREIRAAFISRPGWNLVAADYSQIELRVLAHMSGDKVLTESFRKGEDIHTRTAAEVFGVAPLLVGPEDRRRAKAVNFGIVYGQSAFGLAQQLGIPVPEAREYIDAYFARYAGVKAFMDSAIARAKRDGYSKTMFGRRRPIPDLDNSNPNIRGFAERTAINSPIQGSAADLIKLAMPRVEAKLREAKLEALLLLQVHDELLLEAPEAETEKVAALVKHEMENVYSLNVPLVVDVKLGKNWRDMTAAL